jgi:hypothetical protein
MSKLRAWLKYEYGLPVRSYGLRTIEGHESALRVTNLMLADPDLPNDFSTTTEMRAYVHRVHPTNDEIDLENAVASVPWLMKRYRSWQKRGHP